MLQMGMEKEAGFVWLVCMASFFFFFPTYIITGGEGSIESPERKKMGSQWFIVP